MALRAAQTQRFSWNTTTHWFADHFRTAASGSSILRSCKVVCPLSYRPPVLPLGYPSVHLSHLPGLTEVRASSVNLQSGPQGHAIYSHVQHIASKGFPYKKGTTRTQASHTIAFTLPESAAKHNELQQEHYDRDFAAYIQEIPQSVTESLQKIAKAANLQPAYKVLDCGCGVGRLIPHLLAAGVQDIVAVDLSVMMIALVKEQFDDVRCWQGDIVDLPATFGPFDVVFLNEVLESVHSQEVVLQAVARLLRPGGAVVVSHSEGRSFSTHQKLREPELHPHNLPDSGALEKLAGDVGLNLESCIEEASLFVAVLRDARAPDPSIVHNKEASPLGTEDDPYYFAKAPLYMKTPVVSGFGRGSRDLGFPTANLDPELLTQELDGLMNGVYFGWARLVAAGKDDRVHKMVMNVGNRPTFADGAGQTVEVHVLNKYEDDFYGDEMRIVVLGCIRPEQKFSSVGELVSRITKDAKIAQSALEEGSNRVYRRDPFLLD